MLGHEFKPRKGIMPPKSRWNWLVQKLVELGTFEKLNMNENVHILIIFSNVGKLMTRTSLVQCKKIDSNGVNTKTRERHVFF